MYVYILLILLLNWKGECRSLFNDTSCSHPRKVRNLLCTTHKLRALPLNILHGWQTS